jgi:hypothetical protein
MLPRQPPGARRRDRSMSRFSASTVDTSFTGKGCIGNSQRALGARNRSDPIANEQPGECPWRFCYQGQRLACRHQSWPSPRSPGASSCRRPGTPAFRTQDHPYTLRQALRASLEQLQADVVGALHEGDLSHRAARDDLAILIRPEDLQHLDFIGCTTNHSRNAGACCLLTTPASPSH